MESNIKFISLDNGRDAALVINGDIVGTVDAELLDDGSMENLETIANNIARALKAKIEHVYNHPTPDMADWTWSDIVNELNEHQGMHNAPA